MKDSYPLPHIQDTLDMLYGNSLFTKLDFIKEYHQIEVEETNREKTAFTIHVGLFQYIRLSFGLTNAPESFQRLLKHVLRDYIGKFVILYINSIIIFSSTFEDHLSHVTHVLQTLRVAHHKVRIDKCQFAKNYVKLLGHLITPSGVGPNKKNIEAASSFPIPTKVKDIRVFLGLTTTDVL